MSPLVNLASTAVSAAQKAMGTSRKTTIAGAVRAVGGVLIGLPLIELAAGTGEQIMGARLSLILIAVGLVLQATADLIGGFFARDNDVSDQDAPAVSKSRSVYSSRWEATHDPIDVRPAGRPTPNPTGHPTKHNGHGRPE